MMDNEKLIEALRACARQVACDDTVCHYRKGQDCVCVNGYIRDAADALENALIRATRDREMIDALRKENLRLWELLDAAKKDLKTALFSDDVTSCTFCANANPDKKAAPYCLGNFCDSDDIGEDEWEWRGAPDGN